MEFIRIFAPFLYSVKYDDRTKDEYHRLFDQWNDLDYLIDFFEQNEDFLKKPIWCKVPVPEAATQQVVKEAAEMEDWLEQLADNCKKNRGDDYDSLFQFLNKKRYEKVIDRLPMKSYGYMRPSMIRMYAIKLKSNCYVITGGGIKLNDAIQDSPALDHVLHEIDSVRKFMIENGIIDQNDLIE